MKVVILAGGLGTRLSEETDVKPKPMVEIGGKPILWHIMRHYARHGFKEFVVALGYKGDTIKQYFLNYATLDGDLTVDLSSGAVRVEKTTREDWIVHLVETGPLTPTGGRVKRLEPWLQDDRFMLTYGDGVSNINLTQLVEFHRGHGRLATVSAVRPAARFGSLVMDGDVVTAFTEKGHTSEGWINGGYMVLERGVFEYLASEDVSLEAGALESLATANQLAAYRHDHFWQCMDTLRDVRLLQSLWQQGNPPWTI